ncbi:TPA: SAM-dependent DNA methyltransferase, partial [Escherichia coli]
VSIDIIKDNLYNISIPLYVQAQNSNEEHDLEHAIEAWKVSRLQLQKQTKKLFENLAQLGYEVKKND